MKKFFATLFAVFLLGSASIMPLTIDVHAAVKSYDDTSISDDLIYVDTQKYPRDPKGEISLIEEMGFVEYAFSLSPKISEEHYGIYLYVYNPTGKGISASEGACHANIALEYNMKNGKPETYVNFEIELLAQSTDKLFCKFKLKDRSLTNELYGQELMYFHMFEGVRRYDVASIDVTFEGEKSPISYSIGKTFKATGFCAGFTEDESATSTLSITSEELEVIDLEVHPTQYLTGADTAGENKQQMLSSVYFSIPQKYMENYGALTFLKAEWYEYRTTPIIVTDDDKYDDKIKSALGKVPKSNNTALEPYLTDVDIGFCISERVGGSNQRNYYGWTFNLHDAQTAFSDREVLRIIPRLDWLLRGENGFVSRAQVEAYAESYVGNSYDEKLVIGDKTYNANLFDSTVEEGHTRGYNVRTVDLRNDEDYIDLKLKNTTSAWQKFCNLFRKDDKKYASYLIEEGIAPILPVSKEDIYDINTVSDRLFISDREEEYLEFADFVSKETDAGNQPYLLRFSVNEYETHVLNYTKKGVGGWDTTEKDFYGVIAPVFLNFRVIHLGFVKETEETIIPVVQTPIDIYPNLTPPPSAADNSTSKKWIVWCIIAGGVCIAGIVLASIFERRSVFK